MTLAELNTPFERHRIIHYGKDGNKVVRHWFEMQHIVGPLYKGRETKSEYGGAEYDVFLLFDGVHDGLIFERQTRHPEWYTIEKYADRMKEHRCDTLENFFASLDKDMERNVYIGNAIVEFTRQVDAERADRYALYREQRLAAQVQKHRAMMEQREAEQRAKEERRKAELEAERAKLLGWADDMTAMRFGRVQSVLDTRIRVDGKVVTKREFIIGLLRDGWMPERKDNVVSYYGSRWDRKESKPRTEYRMCKDNLCYTVSKTEHDFAVYLTNNRERIAS